MIKKSRGYFAHDRHTLTADRAYGKETYTPGPRGALRAARTAQPEPPAPHTQLTGTRHLPYSCTTHSLDVSSHLLDTPSRL
jgi:hypothetical protein